MNKSATYTIYFGSSALYISTVRPTDSSSILEPDEYGTISRAKIVKKTGICKSTTIITDDPARTFSALCREFKVVRAAGGVVESPSGELLMIRLRNRWDLPKGHIEAGEESRTAALREVEEETGVKATALDETPLCTTWHAYDTYGEWELKSTDWWRMLSETPSSLEPQHDEGITEVRWFDRDTRNSALTESYDTIKAVVGALDAKNDKDYE